MSQSLHPEARRFGARSTLQLIASMLLAVTPASANGTFDFDPCTEPDIREFHIDRTLELVSVARDGQAVDFADVPKLTWSGKQTSPTNYEVAAPTGALVPGLGLVDSNRQMAFFSLVSNTTQAAD